jgi:hypothetical protein
VRSASLHSGTRRLTLAGTSAADVPDNAQQRRRFTSELVRRLARDRCRATTEASRFGHRGGIADNRCYLGAFFFLVIFTFFAGMRSLLTPLFCWRLGELDVPCPPPLSAPVVPCAPAGIVANAHDPGQASRPKASSSCDFLLVATRLRRQFNGSRSKVVSRSCGILTAASRIGCLEASGSGRLRRGSAFPTRR